jgi:hypothetical protein
MATIDLCFNTICSQRKQLASYSIPPVRFNLTSPYLKYPQYKQNDFDMRRKAEILKYDKNSSQTNKPTKKQLWSKLNTTTAPQLKSFANKILYNHDGSGNYTPVVVKYPDTYTVVKTQIDTTSENTPVYSIQYIIVPGTLPPACNPNVPTPSTSSGVPGPAVNLYLDENVPLYNYASNTRNYAIINPNITDQWNTVTTTDISFNDSIVTTLFKLIINNPIKKTSYVYSIQTPISLFFHGTLLPTAQSSSVNLLNNVVKIQNISITVLYNNQQIVFDASKNQVPVISPVSNYETIGFDISMTPYNSYGGIKGQIYLGMLNVSNINLQTQPGYIYDVKLTFTMASTLNAFYLSYFSDFTSGVLCNSRHIQTSNTNCRIKNNFFSQYSNFLLSGS